MTKRSIQAYFTIGWDSRDSAEHSVTKEVPRVGMLKMAQAVGAKVRGNGDQNLSQNPKMCII